MISNEIGAPKSPFRQLRAAPETLHRNKGVCCQECRDVLDLNCDAQRKGGDTQSPADVAR